MTFPGQIWLRALLSGDETRVDSVIVTGLIAIIGLVGMSAYQLYQSPQLFGAIAFGSGAAAIIGAVAGGKTARDRWAGGQNVDTQPRP